MNEEIRPPLPALLGGKPLQTRLSNGGWADVRTTS